MQCKRNKAASSGACHYSQSYCSKRVGVRVASRHTRLQSNAPCTAAPACSPTQSTTSPQCSQALNQKQSFPGAPRLYLHALPLRHSGTRHCKMYAKRRRAAPNAESQRTRADQDSQKRPGEFTVELNYPETLVVKTKVTTWIAMAHSSARSASYEDKLHAAEHALCVRPASTEQEGADMASALAALVRAAAQHSEDAVDAAYVLDDATASGQSPLLVAHHAMLLKLIGFAMHGQQDMQTFTSDQAVSAAVKMLLDATADAAMATGAVPDAQRGASVFVFFDAISQDFWATIMLRGSPEQVADAAEQLFVGVSARFKTLVLGGSVDGILVGPRPAHLDQGRMDAVLTSSAQGVARFALEASVRRAAEMSLESFTKVVQAACKAGPFRVHIGQDAANSLASIALAALPRMSLYQVTRVMGCTALQPKLAVARNAQALAQPISDAVVRLAPSAPAFTDIAPDGFYRTVGILGDQGLAEAVGLMKARAGIELHDEAQQVLHACVVKRVAEHVG